MSIPRFGFTWLRSAAAAAPQGEALSRPRRRQVSLIMAILMEPAVVARGQVVTEFPIPTAGSAPFGIAAGPDGNLWFTEYCQQDRTDHDGRRHHRVPDPHGRQRTLRHRGRPGRQPLVHRIRVATRSAGSRTAGVVTEFPIPTAGSSPRASRPARTATSGSPNTVPTRSAGSRRPASSPSFRSPRPAAVPRGIAAGPDGNLWFTENSANKIGRITTAGVITEFPIPTAGSGPSVSRPARTATSGSPRPANQIGRITTAGVITEFPIPTAGSSPAGIAAGPDGNLWFTESNANKIGRITTAGVITEFPIPTAGSGPFGIAAGPDGNLWFTELGRQPDRADHTPGPAPPTSTDALPERRPLPAARQLAAPLGGT